MVGDVGSGVTSFTVGDRVAYAGPMVGVYPRRLLCPRMDVAVPVPDELSSALAAAVLLQRMTGHVMTHDVYRSSAGTVALVHGAGARGSLIVQFLLAQGATVIASTSSDKKGSLLRTLGLEHVVNYLDTDLVQFVHRVAPDGADVVFDSVGRSTFEATVRALRPRGTMVAFG